MNNTSIQNKYNENIEILQNAFTVDNKEIKTLDNILKNKEKNEMNFNQKTFIKEYKIINLNKNADNNNENLYINLSKKIEVDSF